MQRMAAEQPCDSARKPSNQTVLLNSFESIFRACRREAARRRQPWRDDNFVSSHTFQYESSRHHGLNHLSARKRPANSVRKSSNSRSLADRLGFTTTSNPVGINVSDVRRISLTLLLIRFRSCALPSFRGVVRPKRLYFNPFGSANNTKERELLFTPLSYTF